jgi:hypothetical protein
MINEITGKYAIDLLYKKYGKLYLDKRYTYVICIM